MSYIKDNIRWSIQLSDEAETQLMAMYKANRPEAATIAVILQELQSDKDLEKHLTTQGFKTDDYKICFVDLYVRNRVYIWRISINAECNEAFTPIDVRLLYFIDRDAKVFKIIDIMPRGKNYGDDDPEYQKQIIERYWKYNKSALN